MADALDGEVAGGVDEGAGGVCVGGLSDQAVRIVGGEIENRRWSAASVDPGPMQSGVEA